MRLFATALAVFLVLAAGEAWAGWDEGVEAYERGEYATALREGRGISQDYADAVKWYRKAAINIGRDDASAMYRLGNMYYDGLGVPQDYVLAHMWFNLAPSNFPAPRKESRNMAVESRNSIAAKMTPSQIEEAQSLAREWMQKHRKYLEILW